MAKRFKLMLVEWVDSCRLNSGWMDMVNIPEPYHHLCVTVGFEVAKNKRGVVLVPTIGDTEHPENSHTYGGMMIPRSAIVRSEVLR